MEAVFLKQLVKFLIIKRYFIIFTEKNLFVNNNKIIAYMDNFNNLIMTGSYASQYEIINICLACKINVWIYKIKDISANELKNSYNYETKISAQEDYNQINPFLPILLIGWINENHYELLIPKNIKNFKYHIEYNIKKNSLMGHKDPKDSNNKILSTKEDINEENNSKLENTSKIWHIDKYKYELIHYIENKDSIYPEIKRCINGKKRLEDIYNYLKSKNIDNYSKNNK